MNCSSPKNFRIVSICDKSVDGFDRVVVFGMKGQTDKTRVMRVAANFGEMSF